MEQAYLPELPEEMIVRILCFLPVQSLIRFTCVSKRFRSIILSDPKFAKSQLQAARDRKTLTRKLLYTVFRDPNPKSIDLETLSSVRNLNFPSQSAAGYVSLLGSCNGIVFVSFNHQVYYMWNPSTGFSKALPDPGIEDHLHDIFSGVGYFPATDDYRVLVAYCGDSFARQQEVAIFSSRANAWETLKFEKLDVIYHEGTLLKETLHWIDFFHGIVAFDLTQREDHKFRKMLLPKAFKDDRPDFYDIFLSAGECLLLAHRLKVKECIHVWIMREYDVPDSWTKLFSLKFSGPPKEQWRYMTRGSVLVMETCTVFTILVGDKYERVLTKILHEGGECSFYKIEGLCRRVVYQESRLPIDDY